MKTKPLLSLFSLIALLLLPQVGHAAVIPASIDFGTAPKDGDGGFTLTTPTDSTWTIESDSLRYTRTASNANGFALQQFDLVGENFTLTTEAKVLDNGAPSTGNGDRFGFMLFSSDAPGSSGGISLLVKGLERTDATGSTINIRTGINGSDVAQASWTGETADDSNFTLTADVTYINAGADFTVKFTVSDGTVSQNISNTFSSASFTDNYFGLGQRSGTYSVEYDTFDISPIPEPSTFAMLFGGLGMLIGLRRNRRS